MDVKGGGAATAPGGEENIRRPGLRVRHDTGGFTGWSQGRRLGGGLGMRLRTLRTWQACA